MYELPARRNSYSCEARGLVIGMADKFDLDASQSEDESYSDQEVDVPVLPKSADPSCYSDRAINVALKGLIHMVLCSLVPRTHADNLIRMSVHNDLVA